jgi:hypothetical protein
MKTELSFIKCLPHGRHLKCICYSKPHDSPVWTASLYPLTACSSTDRSYQHPRHYRDSQWQSWDFLPDCGRPSKEYDLLSNPHIYQGSFFISLGGAYHLTEQNAHVHQWNIQDTHISRYQMTNRSLPILFMPGHIEHLWEGWFRGRVWSWPPLTPGETTLPWRCKGWHLGAPLPSSRFMADSCIFTEHRWYRTEGCKDQRWFDDTGRGYE